MSWNDSALRAAILAFVGMRPNQSADELAAAVNSRAARFQSPQFVPSVPAGCFSSTATVILPSALPQTAAIDLVFNEPVMIVGLSFGLSPVVFNANSPPPTPTLRDVLARVTLPVSHMYLGQTTNSPSVAGTDGFVPLADLSIATRLMMLPLSNPTERVQFTYRSRYGTATASSFAQDIAIDVTAIWLPQ